MVFNAIRGLFYSALIYVCASNSYRISFWGNDAKSGGNGVKTGCY